MCFGSDYPHPEGLDDPLGWIEHVRDLPEGDVRRIMSENMFELTGVTPPEPASSEAA